MMQLFPESIDGGAQTEHPPTNVSVTTSLNNAGEDTTCEDGQSLILSPYVGSAAALSALPVVYKAFETVSIAHTIPIVVHSDLSI